MELVELKANYRSETGKKGAKKCRNLGLVPGILYGKKEKPSPVSVDPKELNRVLHTRAGTNAIIKLTVDETNEAVNVVVKELQVDTIKGNMTHVDFCHISLDELIQTAVPFRVVGEAPGVKQGGILEHTLWELEIESLPLNIPDAIEVDISQLELGDSLLVGDLQVPEGITILSDWDAPVVSIIAPRVEPTPEEVAAPPVEGAEPEVITRTEKEAEEKTEKQAEKRKPER
jgi:large subunit ribosomal protein L25